jgi:hypothetical protein
MPGAFVGFDGGQSAPDGSTVTIKLVRDDGTEEQITFSADVLDGLAIALLEMKAAAESHAQAGVPTSDEAGGRFVGKALRVAEFRLDVPDRNDVIVLNFWNSNRAHLPVLVPREFVRQLRTRLAQI